MTNGTNGINNRCTGVTTLDPVQALVDYVNDIKPFHTKIIEVLVDYQHRDMVYITVGEELDWDIDVTRPAVSFADFICEDGGYSSRTWGDPYYARIISPDPAIAFADYPAMTLNTFIIAGDRTNDYQVGKDVEIIAFIEEYANVLKIVDIVSSVGSPLINQFVVEFVGGSPFPFAIGDVVEVTGTQADDDTPFTISGVTFSSPNEVTVDVAQKIDSTFVSGHFGLVKTAGTNTGTYTISDVEFNGGTIDSWAGYPDPSTIVEGEAAHTVVTVSGFFSTSEFNTLTSTQAYDVSSHLVDIEVDFVLAYSNAVRHITTSPLSVSQTPDEGNFVRDIVAATPSSLGGSPFGAIPDTGKVTVSGNLLVSNIFVGDAMQIAQSSQNNGTYTISSLVYDDLSDETTIGVIERIQSSTADGLIVIDIPSNVFVVTGDHKDRFTQGKVFKVVGGSYSGTYTTLTSDYTGSDVTRIRTVENIIASYAGTEIIDVGGSPTGFIVFGDQTDVYPSGQVFNVFGSRVNDGSYTTSSSSYNSVTERTTVVPVGLIDSAESGGRMTPSDAGLIIDAQLLGYSESRLFCDLPEYTDDVAQTVIKESLVFQWVDTVTSIIGDTRWQIVDVNAPMSVVYVDGDITNIVGQGDDMLIIESRLNDGWYEVLAIFYDSGTDRTRMALTPKLPYGAVDSPPQYGYIEWRPITNTQFFQYPIIEAFPLRGTPAANAPLFVVFGNATLDLEDGQPFRVLGGTPNDGVYEVDGTLVYNSSTDTTDVPVKSVGTNATGGFVESFKYLGGIVIQLRDTIGITIAESTAAEGGALVTTAGHLVGPWDYNYWDVGSFDERLDTLIHLYGVTFD